MCKKDITEKNLEAWNDVFADIVNVLLFKGENLVKEADLEADTKASMLKATATFMNRSATSQSSGKTAKYESPSLALKTRRHKTTTCR